MIGLGLRGDEAVPQALRTLMFTAKGSVPFRPNFGLAVEDLLGGTANNLAIAAAVTEQIETYEPRVRVKQVQVLPGDSVGHSKVRVRYTMVSTGEEKAFIEEI